MKNVFTSFSGHFRKFILFLFLLPLCCGGNHKNIYLEVSESVFFTVTDYKEEICINKKCNSSEQRLMLGTSFMIDKTKEQSVFMSVAHLCFSGDIKIDLLADDYAHRKSAMYLDVKGTIYEVDRILYWDPAADLCIFSIEKQTEGIPLRISKKEAEYGEEVFSIGGPGGYFVGNKGFISPGIFSGNMRIKISEDERANVSIYSLSTLSGMSGSPIVNRQGKVVGVVASVHMDWHRMTYSPRLKDIRSSTEKVFLK